MKKKGARIAADLSGHWVTVWQSNSDADGAGADNDIWVASSGDNGAKWTTPHLLNSTASLDGASDDFGPSITVNASGQWLVAWLSNYSADASDTDADLFMATSNDEGLSWSAAAPLDPAAASSTCDYFDIVIGAEGVALALSKSGETMTMFRSLDAGATWSVLRTFSNVDQYEPRLLASPSGLFILTFFDFVVSPLNTTYKSHVESSSDGGDTWQDFGGKFFRRDYNAALRPDDTLMLLSGDITAYRMTSVSSTSAPVSFDPRIGSGGPRTKIAFGKDKIWVAVWESYQSSGGTMLTTRSVDDGDTWEVPRYLTSPAISDKLPKTAAGAGGTWVSVWESEFRNGTRRYKDSNILSARSTDEGTTWSEPVLVSEHPGDPTFELHIDTAPEVASDGSRTFLSVWVDSSTAFGSRLMMSRSTDAGLHWSTPAIIADQPFPSSFDLTTDGFGNWVVLWIPVSPHDAGPSHVHAIHSIDDGLTWSASSQVNSDDSKGVDIYTAPRLAYNGYGRWLAIWKAKYGTASLMVDYSIFAAYSDDFGATWSSAVQLSVYDTSPDGAEDTAPDIACGFGQCMAMWQSPYGDEDEDIFISRSEDGGETWGAPWRFKNNTGDDYKPTLSTDGRGNWVAAWRSTSNLNGSGSDLDIFYTYSTDNSFHWVSPLLLNTTAKVDGSASDTDIAIMPDNRGHWLGVWQSSFALTPEIGGDSDIFSTNFTFGSLVLEGESEGLLEGTNEGSPEGSSEGVAEGTADGAAEGQPEAGTEGASDGEISVEGSLAGEENPEGEGIADGAADGEGVGNSDGEVDGEGQVDVEGQFEGERLEGEGNAEGVSAEGEGEGTTEGEGPTAPTEVAEVLQGLFDADTNGDGKLDFEEASAAFALEQQDFDAFDSNASGYLTIAELQRQISGASPLHNADTNGDRALSLAEALRVIQLYNAGGYDCTADPDDSEDGYAPAAAKGLSGGCLPHASDYLGGADGKISLSELLCFIQLYNLGAIVPCEEAGEDGFCAAP